MGESGQETRPVNHTELEAFVTELFRRCEMERPNAELLAHTLVVADLGGVHSHGVLRVPEYVKKLTADGVDPKGQPEVAQDTGACLVVDGNNGMGQIACSYAMSKAIERAQAMGVAVAAIRGSNHCGAVGYFAEMALAHDMIGVATTNALPTMAAFGGADPILGINPLAFAIPAGEEQPILYDAAFSGSSHGKIRIHAQKGLKLPEGWALDRAGRPTTDPEEAIHGLLVPIGGFKGAGLAMIMGILSSMLSGAAYGTELGNMVDGPRPGMDGHFLMALNVTAFEDLDRFKSRVDGAIRQVHQSRRAPGVERLYVPGGMEFENRQRYSRTGIPLNQVTLSDLARTGEELGVSTQLYPWLTGQAG